MIYLVIGGAVFLLLASAIKMLRVRTWRCLYPRTFLRR